MQIQKSIIFKKQFSVVSSSKTPQHTNNSFMQINKAFRHVQNLFIQRFLFIHPSFVFIVQGSLLVVQSKQTLDE